MACGGSGGDAGDRPSVQAPEASESSRRGRAPNGEAWVIFGSDTIRAEIASTPEEKQQGLMHRDSLPEKTGMLFVFEDMGIRSFWMQNTFVPLDIAFLDHEYRIVDIQQMEPQTTELHESSSPAMFALEVIQGWFEASGIQVGDSARIVFGRF